MLERAFFFEFAGMPKSGKTTVLDAVSHFLKRQGYRVEEYHGGGRYAGIDKSAMGSLNLYLASKAAEFVLTCSEREWLQPRLFLMDRGLFDRCIFTKVLLEAGSIDPAEGTAVVQYLTMPRLASRIDEVFLFITDPALSVEREYTNKLVASPGRVMNSSFLEAMRNASVELYKNPPPAFSRVSLIDTQQLDGQIIACAQTVADRILAAIGGSDDQ